MTTPPSFSTDALLRALGFALDPTKGARARRALAPFATYAIDVRAVDRGAVAGWVAGRWDEVAGLTRREDAGIRHAALWALGCTGSPRAVEHIVFVLTHQNDHHDHDFAYMAAAALGAVALGELRTIALGDDENARDEAVHALGHLHEQRVQVLPVLGEIARVRGHSSALHTALFNLHTVDGLTLALAGVRSQDTGTRLQALGAAHECLRLAQEQGRPVDGAMIDEALGPTLDEPRIFEQQDPWASMLAWSLEALAWAAAPAGRAGALRALSGAKHRRVRLLALRALRFYPLDRETLGAARAALGGKEPELRGTAALVLRRDAALRARCEAVLLGRVARPGRHDEDWYDIVSALGGEEQAQASWVERWRRARASDVRRRLENAMMVSIFDRGEAAAEALAALRTRCPPSLSRTLLRRWRKARPGAL